MASALTTIELSGLSYYDDTVKTLLQGSLRNTADTTLQFFSTNGAQNGCVVENALSFQMVGATSGNLTMQPAAATTDYTLTMPDAQGASGQVMQNDGSGALSWVDHNTAFHWKEPVVVATTVAGTLATSFAAGQVVNGVTLALNDRILIKDQASGVENGIYIVTAGAPTRSSDFAAGTFQAGSAVIAEEGTINPDTAYVCTNDEGSDEVGVDALIFAAFGGATPAAGSVTEIQLNNADSPGTFGAASVVDGGETAFAYSVNGGTGPNSTLSVGNAGTGATAASTFTVAGAAAEAASGFAGSSIAVAAGAGDGAADGGAVAVTAGAAGATGTGGAVDINAGGATAGTGGAVTIDSGTSAAGAGGAMTLTTASGVGAFDGGAMTVTAGASGAGATGAGGAVDVNAGAAASTNGAGGAVSVDAGAGAGTGAGGNLTLDSGAGGATGAGGNIGVTAGNGGATSGAGGAVGIVAGTAVSGTGGGVNVDAGGSAAGAGGALLLNAGDAGTAGAGGVTTVTSGDGAGTGNGGVVSITSGAGGATDTSAGGAVNITAGTSGATNGDGGTVTIAAGAATGTGTDGTVVFQCGDTAGTGVGFTFEDKAGTDVMTILSGSEDSTSTTSGTLRVVGGAGFTQNVYGESFNAVSDARLKEQITPLSDPLTKLRQIEGYSYKWKNKSHTQKTQWGVLAQQLQDIGLGDVVTGNTEDHLAVNYLALIPLIIESIKEISNDIYEEE